MTIDNAIKLLEVLTKLLGVLVWPVLVTVVLIRFRTPLRDFTLFFNNFQTKVD